MGQKDEIRLIAYYIWLQEGCNDGKDCEHWVRAEAVWKEQQKPSVLITPPPKPVTLLAQGSKRNIRDQHKKK
jgi:hypothetical protein